MKLTLEYGYLDAEGNMSTATPKQNEFHSEIAKEKKHGIFAGGFGTGKTDSICIQAINESIMYPGNTGLMGRVTLDSFRKTTLETLLRMMPKGFIKSHNKQEHEIILMNGSKIYYMQLDASRNAAAKINSMNLGWAAIDQLEEVAETVYLAIRGRLRKKNSRRVDFHSVNPNGHDWVWRTFIKKDVASPEDYFAIESVTWPENVPPPKTDADVARHSDNPHLPADYIRDLLNYPDQWKRRFVHCYWDSFHGLIWSDFSPTIHIIPPIKIEKDWPRFVVMDHGYRHPTSVLWSVVRPSDGTVFSYDTHYQAEMLIRDHATIIRAKSGQDQITDWRADPSIFKQGTDGVMYSDEYDKEGIIWSMADNNVAAGIEKVAQYLKPDENGKAKWYIFNNVDNLTEFEEEMGTYIWKDLKTGSADAPEAPRKKNDHFMDTLRYTIMHAYSLTQSSKEAMPYGVDSYEDISSNWLTAS